MKFDRTLIDSPDPPDIEALKEYFRNNDYTTAKSPYDASKAGEAQNLWYIKSKNIFAETWNQQMAELGGRKSMMNCSPDHPVGVLEKANEDLICGTVAEILSDENLLSQIFESFIEIAEEPLSIEMQKYANSCGKSIDDLNDDEVEAITDPIADAFLGQMMNLMMQSQSLPELMEIVKKNGTHADFSEYIANNFDRDSFIRQWEHIGTKLGSPVSLEQLQEDDENFDCTRGFFDEGCATPQEVAQLEQDFLKTLNKEETDLYLMCKDGKKQKEIAEVLHIQQSSVSKRIAKLKSKFKLFIQS